VPARLSTASVRREAHTPTNPPARLWCRCARWATSRTNFRAGSETLCAASGNAPGGGLTLRRASSFDSPCSARRDLS
jgi:hypothetical protein